MNMQGALVAKKRKQAEPPPDIGDGPTPERLAHAAGAYEIGGDTRSGFKLTTMRDSPIERALARRVISQKQYDAAMKFRNHWYRAGLSAPLASVDMDRVFSTDAANFSGMCKTDAQYFHRERYREAVHELGSFDAMVVQAVVCDEIPFNEIGHKMQFKSTPKAVEAVTRLLAGIKPDFKKGEPGQTGALDKLATLWGI